MWEALLFDVDGTLADTELNGHRPAFNQAFAEVGLEWYWDEELYGELLDITGGKERIRHYLEHSHPEIAVNAEWEARIQALHQAKTRHYCQLLATGKIPLRPGVERVLRTALEQEVRLAIVTTTSPENVTGLLEHTLGRETWDWFDVVAAGDVVAARKPASDIYQWALQRLGLHPAQCLAIEDSANGLRSARGAGITTLITLNDYTRTQDFSAAAAVVSDLGEPGAPARLLAPGPALPPSGVIDLEWLAQLETVL